jgi:hypothetical protein
MDLRTVWWEEEDERDRQRTWTLGVSITVNSQKEMAKPTCVSHWPVSNYQLVDITTGTIYAWRIEWHVWNSSFLMPHSQRETVSFFGRGSELRASHLLGRSSPT